MAELPKSYEAKTVDSKWYQFWQQRSFFRANPNSEKLPYCIVMPPPNVTGVLHMGHALVNTLQDILIRWKRMLGYEVLWVPGTDHAGISTQTVVEQFLIRTENKRRKDYSREVFLEHVWTWKTKNESGIIDQLKRLGCSCDWSRLRFTMDEGNNRAVRTIFKKLYDDNLIYRGDYLVNWDPVTQTALADDEVEHEDRDSFMWYFKYPLADGSGFITIATTRPETMLGDTAIVVSPKDERYQHLIGKMAIQPMTDREIPIISDPMVDPEFGTGAVKVTPAHDHNDYQLGLKHKLPMINIMTPEGNVNENGGPFEGMSFPAAREAIVSAMKEKGLLEKILPHSLRVGLSYRSKAIIEPYLSKQWFVRMDGFAKKLRKIVEDGKVKIIPGNWESTYFHWIDNLRDWCISRQLWWGHRIPIWYNKKNPEQMICYDGLDVPEEVRNAPDDWEQDHDVLDTWFSSQLWPFSTLGWPEKTPELAKFYPNSVLITGHDILFFWVARMILIGDYEMEEVPFPETFLNGLIFGKSYWRNNPNGGITYVTDKEQIEFDLGKPLPKDVLSKWEKMSKSKGNIIDPLEMIDQYGTDALRMALCASTSQARQIDLDRRRFEEFKNFANKVWNGARFVLMNLEGNEGQQLQGLDGQSFSQGLDISLMTLEDHWILSTLNRTVRSVNHCLQNYLFDQAAMQAYDFFWKEFCAYYVELVKPYLFGKAGTHAERTNKQKLLVIVLCQSIRLLHPIAPFITEELFHALKEQLEGLEEEKVIDPYTHECIQALQSPACIVAPYPQVLSDDDKNPQVDLDFGLMEQIIYTIRNIRGEMKLPPGMATDVYIIGSSNDPEWQVAHENAGMIAALVKTGKIEVISKEPELGFASSGIYHQLKIVLPLPEELLKQEKARLQKEQEKLTLLLEKMRAQLENSEFVSRAPEQLIEKHRNQVGQMEKELEEINRKLGSL